MRGHWSSVLLLIAIIVLTSACGEQKADSIQARPAPEAEKTVKPMAQDATGTVSVADAGATEPVDGEALYQTHCAACHEGGVARAPHRTFLGLMTADSIHQSLVDGLMQQQAHALESEEKIAIAEFLAGPLQSANATPRLCEESTLDTRKPALAKDMGFDFRKSRFLPTAVGGLDQSSASRLKLKWAFAFPGAFRARSLPLLAGGQLFVGSHDGTVYALDPETACIHWMFKAAAEVRTALTTNDWQSGADDEKPLLFFGDILAHAYAVDARDGTLVWKTKVDEHDNATITGAPVFYDERLYVPVSSLEVASAADPNYPCCTFRGSMMALSANDGSVLWKTHTVLEEPTERSKNKVGTPMFGPSGSPIWNSPTIDVERGVLYAGTGENYSSPADESSDAIHAFDLKTGKLVWRQQFTAGDAWNMTCETIEKLSCPDEDGPDYDFAASPVLLDLGDGKDMLVVGQKSGWVYGLDPDNAGQTVWSTRVGRGGVQGGVHFGMAAEGSSVFVGIADFDGPPPFGEDYGDEQARPGLYALNARNGEYLWKQPHPTDVCQGREFCDPGVSAALSAIPGAVISGGMDGVIRVHNSSNGEVIWAFNSAVDFATVNGVKGIGGSIGGPGATAADGVMYINSGYGMYFHMPGNVLLAFEAK